MYHIKSWKTEKIKSLRIPMDAFFIPEKDAWHPTKRTSKGVTTLSFHRAGKITGKLLEPKKEILSIESIEIFGKSSAYVFEHIFKPALEFSTGELVAVCVWELGTGTVANAFAQNRLIVKDGEVNQIDVSIVNENRKEIEKKDRGR
jgi:hypothetical protein